VGLFGIGDKVVEKVADTANNAIRQLPTDHNRIQDAKEVIEATKEQDIEQTKLNAIVDVRNPVYVLKWGLTIAFLYSYLFAPFIDDVFHCSLHGLTNEEMIDNLLWAVLGLSGMYTAKGITATIVNKRK